MTQHNTTARASRRADGHFTMIANAAIRDPRLSWKAKGILAGALSHGPGFRFNRDWFIRNATDGESAVRSALQELREHGYLVNERLFGEGGRITGHQLHFTDDPALLTEETHKVDDHLVENPPGGQPPCIRRSIERTSTGEDQEPPLPPSGGKHPQDGGLMLFRADASSPAAGGTVNAVPQPQEPAPSPTKRKRVNKPKPPAFEPTPDDVPAALLPVQDALLAFWKVKGGSPSHQAWKELLGDLERIWRHSDGGIEVVRAQLGNGIQNGWQSITFSNWRKYGQPAPARVAAQHRPDSQQAMLDRFVARANELEAMGVAL